jgi:hypothetical protein
MVVFLRSIVPRLIAAAFVLAATPGFSAERQSALNGTLYTTVAPTFYNDNSNLSFIRFANLDASAASDFTVTVLGSPSGNTYGSTTIHVPAHASPQYPITQLVSMAGAATFNGGDTNYSFYIRNASLSAAYQHVLYNGNNGFFENLSTCVFFPGAVYKGLPQSLINVHTTRLSAYPSNIVIHNMFNAAVTYRATIYDAATGTQIGSVDVPLRANESQTISEATFEQRMNWTPAENQLHVNFIFSMIGGNVDDFFGTVSHVIFNSVLQASINMSTLCRVQRP